MTAPRAQRYTVMVVSDHSKAIRKFHIREGWLRKATIGIAAVGVLATATLAHYLWLLGTGAENRALRDENAQLRSQIRAVEERVAHISATLDRVERFDANLRGAVSKLQQPERGLAIGPVGKPESERPAKGGGLPDRLTSLASAAERQESSLRALQQYFDEQHSLLASTPSAWPTRGWVTSDFGERLDPYTAERMMHRGLDIATPTGQPIYAPSDGTVSFAGTENGYGKVLVLDHGYGVNTRYGHLSSIYVKPGQRVKRGTRVAAVGNTGRSTGPHLHYEVRVNGIAENPRKFILE